MAQDLEEKNEMKRHERKSPQREGETHREGKHIRGYLRETPAASVRESFAAGKF